MAAEFFAVEFWPAEHLAEEGRDMRRVIARHAAEYRFQQRIAQHLVVKGGGQAVERLEPPAHSYSVGICVAHHAGLLIGLPT